MRELILDATLELYKQHGYDQTTMRLIAEKIEYSPAAIYPYFSEKDELFFALHKRGFAQMRESFTPLEKIEHPYERLRALGKKYIEFALEHPDYYDLMFLASHTGEKIRQFDNPDQTWAEGCEAFAFLRHTVVACMQEKFVLEGDPDVVAFSFWSQVHGMVSSVIRDRIVIIPPEKRENLLHHAYDYFMKQNDRATIAAGNG